MEDGVVVGPVPGVHHAVDLIAEAGVTVDDPLGPARPPLRVENQSVGVLHQLRVHKGLWQRRTGVNLLLRLLPPGLIQHYQLLAILLGERVDPADEVLGGDHHLTAGVHHEVLQPGLLAGGTEGDRHVARQPAGPRGDDVCQAARTEEADPDGVRGVAQQADDPLGEVPAPHVDVLVQVVSVDIRQRYPLSEQINQNVNIIIC